MKIIVISSHPLQDNRISKMIKSVTKNNEIIYINVSTQQSIANNWFKNIKIIKYNLDFDRHSIIKDIFVLKKIARIIKKERPDIVHVHDPYFIPLFRAAKKMGVKTVYDKHEAYEVIKGFAGKTGAICEKIFYKEIDGIVYVTKSQEEYINGFKYKSKKLIPNYQSQSAFSRITKDNHEGIKLFYAGDLSDVSRNTTLMLKLVDSVLKQYKYVSCIIAGKTNDPNIKSLIKKMEENDNFKYVDYMLYDDVIRETVNSDIGLYLTKYDKNNIGSSPNKINEYLLAGIVVFSQGRFNDWNVIDGYAGRVFDYSDSLDSMKMELIKIIENPTLMRQMKNNSFEIGKTRTWESIENRYLELYKEIGVTN